MRTIELLAPAKDLACGMAAIDSGADAVYIGGPSFGARVNAANSLDDIRTLCSYAHLYGAKIHVTLNTILTDEELLYARELTWMLYDAGVDALIIQDYGLINGDLPPLEIHASTQQDNYTVEKVQFLEAAGFSQVVLARELSINEIKNIKAHTNVKLESFIHGALCVGISGRCYLSAAITGRSANRGECAQLCRVAQSLYDSENNCLVKNKFLLSMKDLNQTKNIGELIDAGISSFKIEGRLKDENYVRNVTAWYRARIDEALASRDDVKRSSFGKTQTTFTPDVSKSFNRGFTEYNTHEEKDNYANFLAPGFVGNPIGELIEVQDHNLVFKLNEGITLNNGDSLNYYQPNGTLDGFRISSAKDNVAEIFQELPSIKPGTIFYRNKDASFEKLLNNKSSSRHLALNITYNETATGIELIGTDETATTFKVTKELPELNSARDLDKLKTNLVAKIGRLGDTPYRLEDITLNLTNNWFVPVSILNDTRRELVQGLNTQKQERRQQVKHDFKKAPQLPKAEAELGFRANIYNKEAKKFYEEHGAINTIPAYEITMGDTARPLLVSKHCLRYCMGMCPIRHKVKPQDLTLEIGNNRFKLEFDCKKCLMTLVGPI